MEAMAHIGQDAIDVDDRQGPRCGIAHAVSTPMGGDREPAPSR